MGRDKGGSMCEDNRVRRGFGDRQASGMVGKMGGRCDQVFRDPIKTQVQSTPSPHPKRLTPRTLSRVALLRSIFITHMHGDHCFGLGAALALLDGAKVARQADPARRRHHVYGPPGLAVSPTGSPRHCLH